MKSKSPFAIKSPLRVQVYGGDTYESPDTVITKTVGEQVGKAITGLADVGAKYMDLKGKLAKGESDHTKAMELANLKYGKKTSGTTNLGSTTPDKVGSSFGEVPKVPDLVSKSKTSSNIKGETFTDQNAWDSNRNNVQNDARFQGEGGMDKFFTAAQDYRDKNGTGTNTTYNKGKTRFEDGKRTLAVNMKGSPVKHNAGAVGSIASGGGQNNPSKSIVALFGQDKANNMQQKMTAMKSQQSGSGIFGTIAQAASQGGSGVGSFNREGILAADTSVDASLPPPNQVAETGSYGGSGDRILEMDSNPVGNQSIGRNTDITSQLFGSGQRASMLAMKGTPLHHDSEKQAHSHPSKTTTKMKPDGEYPGAKYVKGDLVDQDDLLDKTKLDAHIATQVQSDKKGTFIKEKSDDGPGSDIETSKGFGKKIRLESMGRSSYTSNMKDQLDPNDFLFKNTPKK
jgi:hypothetical protein